MPIKPGSSDGGLAATARERDRRAGGKATANPRRLRLQALLRLLVGVGPGRPCPGASYLVGQERVSAGRQPAAGGRSGERPRAVRYELGDSLVSRRRESGTSPPVILDSRVFSALILRRSLRTAGAPAGGTWVEARVGVGWPTGGAAWTGGYPLISISPCKNYV